MRTLLELVKDLDWPEGAVCVVQDGGGYVKWIPSMPIGSRCFGGSNESPDGQGHWWFLDDDYQNTCAPFDALGHIKQHSQVSDWKTAVITKAEWESVQTK